MGRQQYIVRPIVMDGGSGGSVGSGSDSGVQVAGSSGVVSDTALAHAPTLTESTLREHGIPLHQAIRQVWACRQESFIIRHSPIVNTYSIVHGYMYSKR